LSGNYNQKGSNLLPISFIIQISLKTL